MYVRTYGALKEGLMGTMEWSRVLSLIPYSLSLLTLSYLLFRNHSLKEKKQLNLGKPKQLVDLVNKNMVNHRKCPYY